MIMKDIEGFEGLYAVTDEGQVWSYKRKIYLRPQMVGCGYCQVCLYKNGEQRRYYVHQLVAKAFLSNPSGYTEVNHKDEDKTNNRLDNLEWCDRHYNMTYGRLKDYYSRKVYCVETDTVYDSQKAAAEALGVTQGNISNIINGRGKTIGGYHFMSYEEYINEKEKTSQSK